MADLQPTAVLEIADDVDVFGSVDYIGDSMTWPLATLLNEGRPGNTFSGLTIDPTGNYLMQSPVPVWVDADPSQWTTTGGTFTYGTGGADVGGKKFLKWPGGTAANTATHTYARAAEEGLTLRLFIGQPVAGATPTGFYIQFNSVCRLALEAGKPIRLQKLVSAAWVDVATASALGDCETYLSSVNQALWVDVLPMTNAAWTPLLASTSGPPPNLLCVSLNGSDAVLTVPAATFSAGSLLITSQNRQWSCAYAKKRFGITAGATLETQARVVDLQGTPTTTAQGYVPASGGLTFAIVIGGSPNQAYATLSIAVSGGGVDGTTYAVGTVYLSALTADWGPIETPAAASPVIATYYPMAVDVDFWWDQATMTARASGSVTFVDSDGSFAPGASGVLPACRAFTLYLGYVGQTLTRVFTGYTGLRRGQGFRWWWHNKQRFVTISLDDRLTKADQTACGYQPAYDNTNHYWAMSRLASCIGFTSADKNFPSCTKYEAGFYQLKYGTSDDPALQPQPNDLVMQAMQEVRQDAGDIDGVTGQIQPMVLGTNQGGQLDYFPMPVGVAAALASPGTDSGLTVQQTFTAYALFDGGGDPYLNELYELETTADLSQIRSEAIFEGIDVQTGQIVLGWTFNTDVTTDPATPGYIGAVRSPYVQISRRNTSLDVVQRQAQLAAVQLRYPSVRTFPVGPLQPALFILTLFQVVDYGTQGTVDPVPYYATRIRHRFALVPDGEHGVRREGRTFVVGQLLGEAAP